MIRGPILRTLTAAMLASGPEPDPARSLEEGAILRFAPGLLRLPPEDDLRFLREELAGGMTLKNVSYHPHGDYLSGLKGEHRGRAREVLREYGRAVEEFLGRVLPDYAAAWSPGKVNFRPLEERGRDLPRHSSNELIHVDAFASGATHGGRTLRFFTNVHPTQPRVWKSAGLFDELLGEFGETSGILPLARRGLAEGPLDRARTGVLRLLARAGLPQATTVDSSPYDRAMKRLHDALKDDEGFQRDESRCTFFEFEPFSSWAVMTDVVSHACVSGRYALVNTWTVPREALAAPELAPYAVLAGVR